MELDAASSGRAPRGAPVRGRLDLGVYRRRRIGNGDLILRFGFFVLALLIVSLEPAIFGWFRPVLVQGGRRPDPRRHDRGRRRALRTRLLPCSPGADAAAT